MGVGCWEFSGGNLNADAQRAIACNGRSRELQMLRLPQPRINNFGVFKPQ